MVSKNVYAREPKKKLAEKVTAEYHRINKYHKISKIRSCVLLISTATTGNRVAKRFVIGQEPFLNRVHISDRIYVNMASEHVYKSSAKYVLGTETLTQDTW